MDADRDRTLRIEIPSCLVAKVAEEPEWTDKTLLNGWSTLASSPTIVYWEGSIDLSGYARDYKTFYPSGGVIQEGAFTVLAGGAAAIVYTVVSSVPVNVENLSLQLFGNAGPGFIGTPNGTTGSESQNWETVIFAQNEVLLINQNLPSASGILQPLTVKQSGSLSPTAAQVLYVVKMAIPLGATIGITTFGIPASRVILPGTMDQEPELEYMMRLSRSVELANQV
jgi:hypothetical protein